MKKSVSTKLNFIDRNSHQKPRVTYTGTDIGQQYNEAYQFYEVNINNARLLDRKDFLLHDHGFEKVNHCLNNVDFNSEDSIKKNLYPEIEKIVAKASGASAAFVFDHTVRRGVTNSIRRPAQHVHVDYTHNTGPNRAASMIEERNLEHFCGKRFVQVNFWRSINGPVEQLPLAFLDSQSLNLDDLIIADIEFKNPAHLGEIYALRYHPDQKWYYYPDMQVNEALLIKGYDTDDSAISKFTPHSAFIDPTSKPDALPRQSIEVRTFAFFDD